MYQVSIVEHAETYSPNKGSVYLTLIDFGCV